MNRSPAFPTTWPLPLAAALTLFAASGIAAPTAAAVPGLSPDAIGHLISAVSLDVMSEASVDACDDMDVPSLHRVRAAWVAWRERHQLAELRHVLTHVDLGRGKDADWDQLTTPMRDRVLKDPTPDKVCAALASDFATSAMDVTALYGNARAAAAALVSAKLTWAPPQVPAVSAAPGAPLLQPSQMKALAKQHGDGWSNLKEDEALRRFGHLYLKGRVQRWITHRYQLVQEQDGREAYIKVELPINAEAWVGRDVVLRGVPTTLRGYELKLSDVALVIDPAGLTPSPLPQDPLRRRGVIAQRVMTAPGRGVPDQDIETVVIHGEADYSNGSSWHESVRVLLRDGTSYGRSNIPIDQLDVAASRKLEPGNWSRWRKGDLGYELQHWNDDGKPEGDWQPIKHLATRRWPPDTKLDGYFENADFSGSLMLGGTTTRRGISFTRDGRFERSFGSVSGSGGMAAAAGAVISSSSLADGKGSSSSAGGTANGVTATSSSRSGDDGSGRRGRYRLSGYTLILDFDNGAQQRLLCFPAYGNEGRTIYVGNMSFSRK